MRTFRSLIGLTASFLCFFTTPAYSLDCSYNIGSEPILFSGNVKNLPAIDDLHVQSEGGRLARYLAKGPENASFANIVVQNVLKGRLQKGETVRVIFPSAWNGAPGGRKVEVSNGPILIGGSRDEDGNIWWGDCYTIRLGQYASIDWDQSLEEAERENREYLRIWKVAEQYDALLADRSPASVSMEDRDRIDFILNEIRDYDRLLDFYRKRYLVKPTSLDGADMAFAAVKLRDLDDAEQIIEQVDSDLGVSVATQSVGNTVKLLRGEPASPPFRSLSHFSFDRGLIVNALNLESQTIVGARASVMEAERTSLLGSVIEDFIAYRGNLSEANFSKSTMRGVKLGSRSFGTDGYLIKARATSFKSAYLERFNSTGDFSGSDFSNASGKRIELEGDFRGSKFDMARFQDVYFRNANFRNSSFKNIHFENGSFSNVDLRGADFSGAIFEGKTSWHEVTFDESTKWPNSNFPEALRQIKRQPAVVIYP